MKAHDVGDVGMDELNGCLIGSGSSSFAEHEIELDDCHGRSCIEARVKSSAQQVCVKVKVNVWKLWKMAPMPQKVPE